MWVNYNFKLFATRTELSTRGSESTIQSSTEETAGSLRNPETRRTPSIMVTVCPLFTFHDQNQSDDGSGLHILDNFGNDRMRMDQELPYTYRGQFFTQLTEPNLLL